MKALLSWLILPIPVLLLIFMGVLFLYLKKNYKLGKYLFSVSIIWLLTISTPFLPNLLVSQLEDHYNTFSVTNLIKNQQPINILVLGAGYSDDERFPANNNLAEAALGRLCEGIRIHRIIHGSFIVTSASGYENEITQAEITRQAAILLGVDSLSIKMQIKPKNTKQEASGYKRLFGDSAQLILVTSAIHMPRAMKLFRKAGLNPLPAPTNHLIKKGKHRDFWGWVPSTGNIEKMESAVHEYVGLVWADIEE